MRPTLSIVVPMYNEAMVISEFIRLARSEFDALGVPYEVLCVDDGSTDLTSALVEQACQAWPELRLVRLIRNSGHQAALTAGYERARGDFVVTMDADLQDPPAVVGQLLDAAKAQEADVVYAVRQDRTSDSAFKRLTAQAYYRLMRRVAGQQVPHDAGDFRLVSRRVIDALRSVPEHNRVYRLIVPWFGFPSAQVSYVRAPRLAGKTKYSVSKMFALALDSVTTFTAAPLRLATFAGMLGVAICLVAMTVSVGAWLTDNTVPGWTSTVATVGLIGAIQLVCIGLLGEYMARLFVASQGRPTYVVGYDSAEAVLSAADELERPEKLREVFRPAGSAQLPRPHAKLR